ncbi:MAG: acetyl-CoA carboxylase biotin carboxyl carrier protein [Lachnospiraceae bacterium]|nr:acetyl-CoA carboxylase biotin carboxyl carrier protein [Lachnospiraceae bacterium]MDD3616428.1 acetyl-CoA carboxylase biotin carboxyl carrier protein [Lachnospiraceae bacterium]
MDLEKIEGLVKILENSSLTELTIKEGNLKISMSKQKYAAPQVGENMAMDPVTTVQTQEEPEEEELFITSPIVGTFYSAAAPDVPAFVKVGDIIKAGRTVCILEAMKMMNEIDCEYDCEIEAILVSNEQKVEYGQPLFRVKKL